MLLVWLLACGGQDDPDPAELCRQEGVAECCGDDECPDGYLCHFEYTCATRGGRWDCSDPSGTQECHQLCPEEEDTGTPFQCEVLTQECQSIQHVQGGDAHEEISVCF